MSTLEEESGLELPPEDRYELLLFEILRLGETYGLYDEGVGWAMGLASDDREDLAIWPSPQTAASCATQRWRQKAPRAISAERLVDVWVPALLRDKQGIAAFYTPRHDAWHVEPEHLRTDLSALTALPDPRSDPRESP